jgi:hypothetical protein
MSYGMADAKPPANRALGPTAHVDENMTALRLSASR